MLDHTETEKQLEGLLIRTPEILMPGLTLVGRQTPIEGGAGVKGKTLKIFLRYLRQPSREKEG
jgi:hypothetical protein